MNICQQLLKLTFAFVLIILPVFSVCYAQFEFNFSAHSNGELSPDVPVTATTSMNFSCDFPGISNLGCEEKMGDHELETSATPYLSELVEINGVQYVHQVIGTVASGFAQEYYIERNSMRQICTATVSPECTRDDDGIRNPMTADVNGLADPTRVAMKQLMIEDTEEGQFNYLVLKDNPANKLLIQQSFTTVDMEGSFFVDMRDKSYSDTTPSEVVIDVNFYDPFLSQYAEWDSRKTKQTVMDNGLGRDSTVTSGQFSYDARNKEYTHVAGEEMFEPRIYDPDTGEAIDIDLYRQYFNASDNIGCSSTRVDVSC